MRASSLGTLGLAVIGAVAFASTPGCESSGNDNNGGGRVIHRDQNEKTNPDGSQTRTRQQVRQTDQGQTVRETETQHREVIDGSGNSSGSNAK